MRPPEFQSDLRLCADMIIMLSLITLSHTNIITIPRVTKKTSRALYSERKLSVLHCSLMYV